MIGGSPIEEGGEARSVTVALGPTSSEASSRRGSAEAGGSAKGRSMIATVSENSSRPGDERTSRTRPSRERAQASARARADAEGGPFHSCISGPKRTDPDSHPAPNAKSAESTQAVTGATRTWELPG